MTTKHWSSGTGSMIYEAIESQEAKRPNVIFVFPWTKMNPIYRVDGYC